jgi:hypothetical protein
MTVWHPDTCGCAVEYTDDLNFTYRRTHAACSRHASVADTPQHLAQLLAENQQKNIIVGRITDATPTAGTAFVIDASGHLTIRASAIPPTLLVSLRRQYPSVTIVVDPTIPMSG